MKTRHCSLHDTLFYVDFRINPLFLADLALVIQMPAFNNHHAHVLNLKFLVLRVFLNKFVWKVPAHLNKYASNSHFVVLGGWVLTDTVSMSFRLRLLIPWQPYDCANFVKSVNKFMGKYMLIWIHNINIHDPVKPCVWEFQDFNARCRYPTHR